jgi:undecaprenyl-diphosphatase
MEDLLKAVFLGIVEGLTEFLPISSTGHLILAVHWLDFPAEGARELFEIFIQLGAVFAVLWYYRAEFNRQIRTVRTDRSVQRLWLWIAVACVPAGVIGVLFREEIKATLFNPTVVAISLIVGGIVFIVYERRPEPAQTLSDPSQLTLRQAVLIGLAQVVALVPGVSRSGATILGGMMVGLSRPAAASFSFFLALPVLGGASGLELLTSLDELTPELLVLLGVGTIVSAIFAFLAVSWLLRYVARNRFTPFGWYRIVLGIAVLIALQQGALA